jgi:hypothetical protein
VAAISIGTNLAVGFFAKELIIIIIIVAVEGGSWPQ